MGGFLLKTCSGSTYTNSDESGHIWYITPSDTKKIDHRGDPAIYQTLALEPESTEYCISTVYRLIIPTRSWSTHEQLALFVATSRCSYDARHDADLKNILDSFRLVPPF